MLYYIYLFIYLCIHLYTIYIMISKSFTTSESGPFERRFPSKSTLQDIREGPGAPCEEGLDSSEDIGISNDSICSI